MFEFLKVRTQLSNTALFDLRAAITKELDRRMMGERINGAAIGATTADMAKPKSIDELNIETGVKNGQ